MSNVINIDVKLSDIDLSNKAILKISVNQKWSPRDFSNMFRDIDILYKNKFWIYKAIQLTHDFLLNPNNKNITFIEFAHSPLAHQLENIKENLRDIEQEGYVNIYYPSATYEDAVTSDKLSIEKIIYASPGFTDILGISGILKEIKETLMYYFPNKKTKEEIEILKQQKTEMQIKNLRAMGFTEIEIKTIFLREDIKFDRLSQIY